jgi:hypothetical protein
MPEENEELYFYQKHGGKSNITTDLRGRPAATGKRPGSSGDDRDAGGVFICVILCVVVVML